MTSQMLQTMRELDSRVSDGIHVRLLWCERHGRVAVAVDDAKTGDSFGVEVRSGDSALEAFRHPYSYAAWRGVASAAARRSTASATSGLSPMPAVKSRPSMP